MKLFSLFLAILIVEFALTACNTIEGLGKDIKAGGAAIERTADERKKQ